MKKIMLVFGTRPEAIKMCPLVRELKGRDRVKTLVCVTGQHRQLLDPVLEAFQVAPDYDLSIMKEDQTLFDVTTGVLEGIRPVLEKERPEVVLVHGDTGTAFAAALACFYLHIPLGHVEAGLRSFDLESPYPEEFNRRAISMLARYHFAPTAASRENLLREGVPPERIYVTGNTVIDGLNATLRRDYTHPELRWAAGSRFVLLTAHRRENWGEPMIRIFRAVRQVVEHHPEVKLLCPLHKNPRLQAAAREILAGEERIHLVEPLGVSDFHNLLARCDLVLTDSGGIQEEAACLGKPVLVLRSATERTEGIAAGTLKLVGTQEDTIYQEVTRLLEDPAAWEAMAHGENPYGDGFASRRIGDILCREEGL